ncbi:MAG: undecaprenyl-phosphate glucose phosphotransferase [Oscillospiraceae bacterium]|nr:undecaprenyl-phosphate glucose phosphotransferase [Oscillospiraceae bacterium]
MRRNKTQPGMILLNVVEDVLLIILAYWIAFVLRFNVFNGINNADLMGWSSLLLIVLYAIGLAVVFAIEGVYSPATRRENARNYLVIFLAETAGTLLLVIYFFLTHNDDFSRIFLLLFWLTSILLLSCKCFLSQKLISKNWDKMVEKNHIVLVGSGASAQRYHQITQKQEFPTTVYDGYVGDEGQSLPQRLGAISDLAEVLNDHRCDELIVALEPHEAEKMPFILSAAEKEGVEVHLVPFFNDYYPNHPIIESYDGINLVNLRSTPLNRPWNELLKRAVDLIGSSLLILLLSPLMVGTAIGVKISSPGPTLFTQDRVGKNKKIFKMYKFRSMRVNAEQDSAWSKDKDPRRTKFGSFIRKYSIDELPQLFNVFLGDMSLIGPRPEIPFYVRQFKESIPLYLVRQQVRPGMTGWAQVNGFRGDTSIEGRVDYDIWYIENWSLWLDIKILFLTAFGGFINNEH